MQSSRVCDVNPQVKELVTHFKAHAEAFGTHLGADILRSEWLDYYVEAAKVIERNEGSLEGGSTTMPTVGLSIDRRVMSHVHEVFHEVVRLAVSLGTWTRNELSDHITQC